VMQRIHELLKPGGILLSSTPCLGGKISFINLIAPIFIKFGIVPSMSFFKIQELEGLMNSAEFKIIETESISPNPINHFIVAKKM
jgi:hypothetical protein